MPTYKITIAYDGTAYSGWQIQPNGVTIQELFEQAVQTILRKKLGIIGSGRTDAGVHAAGQVAHFKTDAPLDLYRFQHSLNGLLPADIRVLSIEPTLENFHAQYSATGKIYHYHLHLDYVLSPFERYYRWHVREKIDPDLLKISALKFIGTHDFTSFANEAHLGSAARNPVRRMKRLDVISQPGGFRLEFEADGFLYKMVRNIVGMMVDVARGKRKLDEIEDIFATKDRRSAASAAPPQGLFLVKVHYPECFQNLDSGRRLL